MSLLSLKRKEIEPLLKRIINHYNGLTLLIDGVDQPKEEKKYKEDHCVLINEVNQYFNSYKEIKKEIFNLIKSIIHHDNQKKLLN